MIPMDPLRKAAIVLSHLEHLEPAQADAMLRQVGPEMAARLRGAVARLGTISPEERERSLAEFMRRGAPSGRTVVAVDDGVELETSNAAHTPPAPAYVASRPAEAKGNARFSFLTTVAPDFLFTLLSRESPQVAAVVVAHLTPLAAANLLGRMTAERQADVLRRVAGLDELNAEVLSEIERHLETICFEHRRQKERRQAGAAAVNAILQAAPDAQRTVLSGTLARLGVDVGEPRGAKVRTIAAPAQESPGRAIASRRYDDSHTLTPPASPPKAAPLPELAPLRSRSASIVSSSRAAIVPTKPEGPLPIGVKFQEFADFDDTTLATVFQQAAPRTALLALAGAPRTLVERILATLPEEEGEQLDRQIEGIGPLRLRDIDAAQQAMARLAGELAARRRIRLPVKASQLTAEA